MKINIITKVKYYLYELIYTIKNIFQIIFSSHHCSEDDFQNLNKKFAKYMLPKLIELRRKDKQSVSYIFSDFENVCNNMTLEEYNEKRQTKEILGGGISNWYSILDEIIFSLEYLLNDFIMSSNIKKSDSFYAKYGYKSPYRKSEDNLSYHYTYRCNNNTILITDDRYLVNPEYEFINKDPFYYDIKLLKEVDKRAREGIKYIGYIYYFLYL
jgi:hypothetical protein